MAGLHLAFVTQGGGDGVGAREMGQRGRAVAAHDADAAPPGLRPGIGTFQPLPGANAGECRYRLSGLAAGWPNQVSARSTIGAGKSAGNSIHRVSYAEAGKGWDGHEVVPQPDAERYYLFRPSLEGSAAVDPAGELKRRAPNPLDPRTNGSERLGTTAQTPQSQRAALLGCGTTTVTPTGGQTSVMVNGSPSAVTALPQARSALAGGAAAQVTPIRAPATRQFLLQKADAVSLNPQPLPPDPPEATATLRALNAMRALAPR